MKRSQRRRRGQEGGRGGGAKIISVDIFRSVALAPNQERKDNLPRKGVGQEDEVIES